MSPSDMADSDGEKEADLPTCHMPYTISNSKEEDERPAHKSQSPRFHDSPFPDTYQSDVGDEYRSEMDDGEFMEELHYGSMSPVTPATTFGTVEAPSIFTVRTLPLYISTSV